MFLPVQCFISEILEEFLVTRIVSIIEGVLKFNAIRISLSILPINKLLKLRWLPMI